MDIDTKVWVALITGGLALSGSIYSASMTYLGKRRQAILESSLRRLERTELSRTTGYEEIWTLTGCLNLFGPTTNILVEEISQAFKKWYFKYGLSLTDDSKSRYFLIQEMLNYALLRSAIFRRPADELLYASPECAVQVLDNLRAKYVHDPDGKTCSKKTVSFVNSCKTAFTEHIQDPETNWIILQYAMSTFRTGLIDDLGLRSDSGKK